MASRLLTLDSDSSCVLESRMKQERRLIQGARVLPDFYLFPPSIYIHYAIFSSMHANPPVAVQEKKKKKYERNSSTCKMRDLTIIHA